MYLYFLNNSILPQYCNIALYSENKRYVLVPDSKSRNIPEVVVVRRWAVGILGFGGEGWAGCYGWGKWGQFTSNLRLGRTVLTQLEGAK